MKHTLTYSILGKPMNLNDVESYFTKKGINDLDVTHILSKAIIGNKHHYNFFLRYEFSNPNLSEITVYSNKGLENGMYPGRSRMNLEREKVLTHLENLVINGIKINFLEENKYLKTKTGNQYVVEESNPCLIINKEIINSILFSEFE